MGERAESRSALRRERPVTPSGSERSIQSALSAAARRAWGPRLGSAPVNVMCQLDWAAVPRCLVRYSRSFCEGFFWMRLTLKSVAFEHSRSASSGWAGLVQLVEGLRRERLTPEAGGTGLGGRPPARSLACSGWTHRPHAPGAIPGGFSAPRSPLSSSPVPPALSPLLVLFLWGP